MGHLAMSEGSAHWEGCFAEAIEELLNATRIQNISLPRHIWRQLKAARIRDVTLRGMQTEGEGNAHAGCCFVTDHIAMIEGSAHWERYFAEGHQ